MAIRRAFQITNPERPDSRRAAEIDIADHDDAFLGLYGQVVLNDVAGASHPYFYVVLVANTGFGLRDAYEAFEAPHDMTAEFKEQDSLEVLVLRRATTKTGGYNTDPAKASAILRAGLRLAESVAGGPQRAA